VDAGAGGGGVAGAGDATLSAAACCWSGGERTATSDDRKRGGVRTGDKDERAAAPMPGGETWLFDAGRHAGRVGVVVRGDDRVADDDGGDATRC
jgi:hypothetical protein